MFVSFFGAAHRFIQKLSTTQTNTAGELAELARWTMEMMHGSSVERLLCVVDHGGNGGREKRDGVFAGWFLGWFELVGAGLL